jgi:hypothetical protein
VSKFAPLSRRATVLSNHTHPAKPNSRTKIGAHRSFESDKRRLSNQKPLLPAHFTQTIAGTDPRQLSDKNHYSLFTVNSAACGLLTNAARSVTIIDIMKKRHTMANIQKTDYPEPRQAFAVQNCSLFVVNYSFSPPAK